LRGQVYLPIRLSLRRLRVGQATQHHAVLAVDFRQAHLYHLRVVGFDAPGHVVGLDRILA